MREVRWRREKWFWLSAQEMAEDLQSAVDVMAAVAVLHIYSIQPC